MGHKDLVVQIGASCSKLNCNFFIKGSNIDNSSNAISEAMEYWRKRKVSITNNLTDPSIISEIKSAEITSINVIEVFA